MMDKITFKEVIDRIGGGEGLEEYELAGIKRVVLSFNSVVDDFNRAPTPEKETFLNEIKSYIDESDSFEAMAHVEEGMHKFYSPSARRTSVVGAGMENMAAKASKAAESASKVGGVVAGKAADAAGKASEWARRASTKFKPRPKG